MMNAARSQLESRWESEKLGWEEQAIVKVDEQIKEMRQLFQQHLDAAQDNTTTILKQKDLEIEKLVADLTKAKYELDISNQAHHDAVEEATKHATEIKKLEERLEVVRGVNKDLFNAGVEKDKKIYQLEAAIEEAQSLSPVIQNVAKEPNEPDGESQVLPRDPNATKESNEQNEYLVEALKRKVASLTSDFDAELKKLKLEMATGFEEVMEEKEKLVQQPKW